MTHNLNDEREQLEAAEFAVQDDAQAELTRLTALLEDRQGLAHVLLQAAPYLEEDSLKLADRIRVYLKPLR